MIRFFFLLIPLFVFTQTKFDFENAVDFQNTLRTYYNLKPYKIDVTLTKIAQLKADYLAKLDDVELSDDKFGETVYTIKKNYV